MKQLIFLFIIVFAFNSSALSQSNRFAPFEVDTVQHIARLNIQVKELSKKFLATFAAQKLNANYASDWQKVIEQVVSVKLPDLSENGDIGIDADENVLEITAPDMQQLQKVLRTVKPYLASPGKMEAFFSEPARPDKVKRNRADREEKEEREKEEKED